MRHAAGAGEQGARRFGKRDEASQGVGRRGAPFGARKARRATGRRSASRGRRARRARRARARRARRGRRPARRRARPRPGPAPLRCSETSSSAAARSPGARGTRPVSVDGVGARRAQQPRRPDERGRGDRMRSGKRVPRRRDDDERVAQKRLGLDQRVLLATLPRPERRFDVPVRQQAGELVAASEPERDVDPGVLAPKASSSCSAASSAKLEVTATRSVDLDAAASCAPPRACRRRAAGSPPPTSPGAAHRASSPSRRHGARRGRRRARGAVLRPRQIPPARRPRARAPRP